MVEPQQDPLEAIGRAADAFADEVLAQEQEAARLLLERLRKLLPAVKIPIRVSHFVGNNPQRYSHDQKVYLTGGGLWVYNDLHPVKRGDQNRGSYGGDGLILSASTGELRLVEWAGSWSQWQEEASHAYVTDLAPADLWEEGAEDKEESYVDNIGQMVPDDHILEHISLDDLAHRVSEAEQQAEENRQKRTQRLSKRSQRAQEIIEVLRRSG